MSLCLVTTAEESSWPDEGKVLFLGEWCKKYDREDQWSRISSITAEPYAIERNQKKNINKYADKLFEVLLCELTNELNSFHEVSYSNRYWNIVIGPWLQRYIKVIINRYKTLELALNSFSPTKTLLLRNFNLVDLTYLDFVKHLNNDLWNHGLYANMLQNWPNLDLEFEYKENIESEQVCQKNIGNNLEGLNVKNLVITVSKFFNIFKRQKDALIIKSYLPIFKEIQLQLFMGQFPQLWRTPKVSRVNVDNKIRNNFFQNYKQYQGVESEVRRLIHVLIPICYLEGYRSISKQSSDLPWPSKPKFIFTSNNFSTDEIFKLWTAKHSEDGVPYYIGQHGNNYGTLNGSEAWTEVTTCDKFLSWGWSDVYEYNKSLPAFIFQLANRDKLINNQIGGLLLIERGPGNRDGCHDRYFEHILYQKYVLNFFSFLDDNLQDKATVRLHHGSKESNSSDYHIWKEYYPSIDIDNGFSNIYKLIEGSRIVVHSYDSTGVLETLSLNIPTIVILRNGLDEIMSEAIPYYRLLISAGIVYIDERSAAQHINKHWGNIRLWWNDKKTQSAREKFCHKYARSIDRPILNLAKLLNNI